MLNLLAACGVFLGIHLVVAGTSLRDRIVGIVGQGPYMGLFSLATLASIIWVVRAYGSAFVEENVYYWALPAGAAHGGSLIMLIAFVIGVVGLLTPGPTSVGMADKAKDGPVGIHRVTRHPFLWGVLIWAAFHFIMNGDRASLTLFGTFFILTALGTRSIDAKLARRMGDTWQTYAASSSNIPFAAIVTGRQKLALGEIGLLRVLAALVVFGILFYAHLWLFGASPVPGWQPY